MAHLLPALLDTIKASRDTVAELADIAVEALDSSKILSDVPVVAIAMKALSVKDAFAQARLKRNCVAFMRAVSIADGGSLQQLTSKLETNREFAEDFSDTVMALLLEAQKPIKCEIVGRLVLAFAQSNLSHAEFSLLAEIVQACTVPALKALPAFFTETEHRPYSHGFEAPGEGLLLSLGVAYRFGNMFRIDKTGQKLYRHGFDGVINETVEGAPN